MYLKELELFGFKSFPEKTSLKFESGITAVVGPNGCGKCLHPDSLVFLANGKVAKIGELVEKSISSSRKLISFDDGIGSLENKDNLSVFSLNQDTLKLEKKRIDSFVRRKSPPFLLKIKTKKGEKIITTHYHPFFAIKKGNLKALTAQELKEGIRIALPRKLEVDESQDKLEIRKVVSSFSPQDSVYVPYSKGLKNLVYAEKKRYGGWEALAGELGVSSSVLCGVRTRQALNTAYVSSLLDREVDCDYVPVAFKSRSNGHMKIPDSLDRNLARFLGYIISEGRTTFSNQVWFVNEDEAIVNDFCVCSRKAFGVAPKVFSYKKCAKDVIIFSSALCKFLDKVFGIKHGGKSDEKVIPPQLFSASPKVISEFISALFEGDAYFKNKQEKGRRNFYVEYSTASKKLAYGLSTLLLRLGVQAFIREKVKCATNTSKRIKRTYYSLYIYGITNIKKIAPYLNLVGEKKKVLKEISKISVKANPNFDIIPNINYLIKEYIKSSKISVKRAKKQCPKLAAYYEDACFPSRRGILEVIEEIKQISSTFNRKLYSKLLTFATSDVYWDEIIKIEKIPSDTEWVYDLCIEGNHNFVADNFIVHNSNVFDAVKWALGEQSPKSLRGAKMEDIIFSGTEHQSPLNYAEVGLTFCNEDKYLPIDYKEVLVARRLYRSGESQYFINKNMVRLKDVQELFMGTGIGEATYSFVEQGKIEIFLSYKPEDKRLIFDEASGIVKYKERKRETLRRLAEAEENLLRLDDILFEVRRQIRYLDRQVAKAKKYKQVQEKLVEVEKKIAAIQFLKLEGKIGKLNQELSFFEDKEKGKESQLQEVSNRWEELNHKLRLLRGKLEEAATDIVFLNARIESSTSHISIDHQRIKELEQRSANLEMTRTNLNQRLQLQEQRSQEEAVRMQAIKTSLSELEKGIASKVQEKDSIRGEVESAKKEVNREKTKVLDLESKRVQFQNTLIETQTKSASLTNRKKRLLLDKAKLDTLLTENRDNSGLASEESRKIEEELKGLQEARGGLARKEKELATLIEDLRSKLVDKEKELLELRASYDFLKDLKIKYETFSVQKRITVTFDEEPKDINKLVASLQDVEFKKDAGGYTAQIEAKVVSFEEKQLEDKIVLTESQIEEIKQEQQRVNQQKDELGKDLVSENTQIEGVRVKLQQSLQEKDGLAREVERLEEESELLAQEEKSTLDDIEDCDRRQKEIEDELALYQADLDKANQSLLKANEVIANGLEKIKNIDLESTRNLAEKQSLHKENEALESKVILFQDEMNNLKRSLEGVEKEEEEGKLKAGSFNSQIESLETKIEEDKLKIEERIKGKQGLEEEEVSLNKDIDKVKEDIQGLEKEAQTLRDSAYNKKLEIQSLEYEKEKVRDYLRQVYQVEFDAQAQGQVDEAIDALSIEKEKLQKRVKSLGEVNLVAIEEFEELKKREEFLDSQKQDLINSKDSLKKAISKINRTSRELFLDTFTKIEKEFKNNFKFLFNGGRANLILIDRDNILESGVEIEVQPPGKKLQNVSLLSGGEKALTAIALIFAIFTVRPSPLCVLDEIDAPLDEANVDRFNHLLKEFAASSQFILITHNKKTMSNADVLYGVTMQERGVSKLVSVKFAAEKVPS